MNWSNKWGEPKGYRGFESKEAYEQHYSDPKNYADEIPAMEAYSKEADLEHVGENKTTLTFLDGNKRRSIDVIIVGDLALDYDTDGWNIYHVPTLACFSKAVPGKNNKQRLLYIGKADFLIDENEFTYDRIDLLSWMKKVQTNYPTSWQMLRLLTPETYADKATRAKEIIQEWCLSVKVEE